MTELSDTFATMALGSHTKNVMAQFINVKVSQSLVLSVPISCAQSHSGVERAPRHRERGRGREGKRERKGEREDQWLDMVTKGEKEDL